MIAVVTDAAGPRRRRACNSLWGPHGDPSDAGRGPSGNPKQALYCLKVPCGSAEIHSCLITEGVWPLDYVVGPAAGWPGGLGSGWSGAPGLTLSLASFTHCVPTRRDTFPDDSSGCVNWGLRRGACGGLAGGAGVRLVRGSRAYPVPGIIHTLCPNTARHISG